MRPIFTLVFFTLSCSILSSGTTSGDQTRFFSFEDPAFRYTGRFAHTDTSAWCAWPGSSISFRIRGTSFVCLSLGTEVIENLPPENYNYVNIIIDGKVEAVRKIGAGMEYFLIDSLSYEEHTVEIYKRTEAFLGRLHFSGILTDKNSSLLPCKKKERPKIEFIGNSITCGYGNEGSDQNCPFSAVTENQYMSYAAIAARKLGAEAQYISYSGKGIFWNYNQDPAETLPQLYDRIDPGSPAQAWNVYPSATWNPALYVINLGTNDFSHQVPDSAVWINTCLGFLEKLHVRNPSANILLCISCMMSDSWPEEKNARSTLSGYLKEISERFHITHPEIRIKVMEMSQQGGLGYGCDWHPNIPQHEKNAGELIRFVKENQML